MFFLPQYWEKCSCATGISEANVKQCRITVQTAAQKTKKRDKRWQHFQEKGWFESVNVYWHTGARTTWLRQEGGRVSMFVIYAVGKCLQWSVERAETTQQCLTATDSDQQDMQRWSTGTKLKEERMKLGKACGSRQNSTFAFNFTWKCISNDSHRERRSQGEESKSSRLTPPPSAEPLFMRLLDCDRPEKCESLCAVLAFAHLSMI